MPRLVIVKVGQGPVVLVDVVELVGAEQQKPTASGESTTSPGLHASRILTPLLKVPPLCGFAHRTAAVEVSTRAIETKTATTIRLMIER